MITTLLLIIIYLSFISLGLPDSVFGAAWPAIYREIGVPVSYGGYIFMVVAAGTIISSFFSDKIISRLNTGFVTLISVAMTATALLGISFGNHFIVFALLAIPLGLGAGSVDAALNNYVALHFSARHMSWLHCFWGVGASVGPMIMSFFLNADRGNGSWQMGYRTVGFIQLTLTVVLILTLPLWKKAQTAQNQTNQAPEEKVSIRTAEVLKLTGAKSILISFFCYCAIEATVGLWGGSYLVILKGLAAEAAARWVAVFFVGITLGRFTSGFLTLKLNNWSMVRLGEGLLILGLICLILPLEGPFLQGGFFLLGLGCAPIYPSLLHETPANFGSKYSQALMGIQMACAYIGNIAMPPLFGFLADHITYSLFPFFLLLLLILMSVMVEITLRRVGIRKRRDT